MNSMLDRLDPSLVCVICKKRKPVNAFPKGSRVCTSCRETYEDDDSSGGKQAREGLDADHKQQHERNVQNLKELIEAQKQDYIDKLDQTHDQDLAEKAQDAHEKHLDKKAEEKDAAKTVNVEPYESSRYGREGLDQFTPENILPDSPLHGDFEKLWIADPRGIMVLNMLNHYFGQYAQIHSHLMTIDRDIQASLGFIAYTDGGTYFSHLLNNAPAPQSAQVPAGATTGTITVKADINTATHNQTLNTHLNQNKNFQANYALNNAQIYNANHSQYSTFVTAHALAFLNIKAQTSKTSSAPARMSNALPAGSLFQKAPKNFNETPQSEASKTAGSASMFKAGNATAETIGNAAKQATQQVLKFMRARSGK